MSYSFKDKIAEATGADKLDTVIDNLSQREKIVLAKKLIKENKKRATSLYSLRQAALAAGISLWGAKLYKRQGKLVPFRVLPKETGAKWDMYKPSVIKFLREERDRGVTKRGNYRRDKPAEVKAMIEAQQKALEEVNQTIAEQLNEDEDDY